VALAVGTIGAFVLCFAGGLSGAWGVVLFVALIGIVGAAIGFLISKRRGALSVSVLWYGFWVLFLVGHAAAGWVGVLAISLPSVVLFWLTMLVLAGWFVLPLQEPGQRADAIKSVLTFALGTNYPYHVIEDRNEIIASRPDNDDHVLRRIGGPGGILVYNDSAVVLERAGKLTRVVRGPAFAFLERFEKVYDVVDLRPQNWVYPVSALTREGIPITCGADVTFQIDDGGQPSSTKTVYPALEGAVLKAATCKWVREADRFEDELDWAGRVVISNTEGTLRTLLARTRLDELVPVPFRRRQSTAKRMEIQQQLEATLRASVPALGAKSTRVYLGDIETGEEVSQQWEDIWRAEWRRWATRQIALGKARRIQVLEEARIQAHVKLLERVAAAFKNLAKGGVPLSSSALALRFIEALQRTDELTAWEKIYLPSQSWETLERVREAILRTGGPPPPGGSGSGAGPGGGPQPGSPGEQP
jgi:hypothetical protein